MAATIVLVGRARIPRARADVERELRESCKATLGVVDGVLEAVDALDAAGKLAVIHDGRPTEDGHVVAVGAVPKTGDA